VGSVFISYRREDSEGQARALFQDLVARLGRDSVFMDVDSIGLGRDFRQVLQERLATCDVMLALIGRDWLDGKDTSGRRRLDNPGDFVRMEIAAALKRNIPVTPLLLHGAHMPTVEQLPEDLSELAYRNGFELSHNRWESDVQELVKRLGLVTRNDTPSGTKTDSAAPTRQPAKKSWVAITGALLVAIAVLSLVVWTAVYISNPSTPLTQAEMVIVVAACAALVFGLKWIVSRLGKTRGGDEPHS